MLLFILYHIVSCSSPTDEPTDTPTEVDPLSTFAPTEEPTDSPPIIQIPTSSTDMMICLDGVSGQRTIQVPCDVGDTYCQGKYVCEVVTGMECTFQSQCCCGSCTGSWYNATVGFLYFNYEWDINTVGVCDVSGFGNICGDPLLFPLYDLSSSYVANGYGNWLLNGVCIVTDPPFIDPPTDEPTSEPTGPISPTDEPTSAPTMTPSLSPTKSPTMTPTLSPTDTPTEVPTSNPTDEPATTTTVPTQSPNSIPTSDAVAIVFVILIPFLFALSTILLIIRQRRRV